ncbi:MAG: hypothetical protein KTR25_16420 [Myxococcales bacterium]|nr:hypothetical protein [Myxococcales bacterium]
MSSLAGGWLSVPERGTVWGIQVLCWLAQSMGRRMVRGLVGLVALYYLLVDKQVRAASREWLEIVTGEKPSFSMIYGHIRRFANIGVDRIFLLLNREDLFQFTRDGHHYLAQLERERTGALLVGAHLGSFEAMRLGARYDSLSINIAGNFSNARMINTILESLSEDHVTRVVSIAPGDFSGIFRLQECISKGEMVAILADRVADNQPSVVVNFFGRPARFPSGPFQLAALLRCPVYLTFGLYAEPNIYSLSCEPFAEKIELPRKHREEALQQWVQRYAVALEQKARQAPDNWFNFYPFWEVSE